MSSRTYFYTLTDSEGGPALVDFDLWRGANLPPVIFGLETEGGAAFPTAGSLFVLTISWNGGLIRKTTDQDDGFALDVRTSKLTWTPTVAESLSIPSGPVAKYEIWRHVGETRSAFIAGTINGKGGL